MTMQRDKNGRRGSPGIVLIITLLVVLGLSLLGAIIVDSTRTDTTTAGNVRQARQTAYVAEVGAMVAMHAFALNHSTYRSYMTRNRRFSYNFDRASFDLPAATAVTLIDSAASNAGWSSLGWGSVGSTGVPDLRPDYDILIDRAYELGDSQGYSVSGTQGVSFCFRRYTFTSSAELDVTLAGGLPGSPRQDARSMMRATSIIGPTDCTL
jgi:hypothetical protein